MILEGVASWLPLLSHFNNNPYLNKKIMKQVFFAEQTLEGTYIIVRYNKTHEYLVPVRGEVGYTEEKAIARARELNEDYFAEPED